MSSSFQLLFTISFLISLEHREREILHVPTVTLTLSIYQLTFPPIEMDNLFPVPNSTPAPPRESWIPFPLTLLKDFYPPITARAHIIRKIQRRAKRAKQRKEKEQNEVEERTSRWLGEKGKNSLEICLGSRWFVYFCYHLICNFFSEANIYVV